MHLDDIIYVICLLACIAAGSYVRKIKADRMVFTAIGVFMVVVVSGTHSLHCFISWFLGSVATIYVRPSKCHLVTFFVMFGYLTFFRLGYIYGLPDVPGHTNMIQMLLTLKVSGIAFERTAAWKKIQHREHQLTDKSRPANAHHFVHLTDYDVELQNISFTDIFHYTFNYIGVLTGPYYRYRTYRDYFDFPFRYYAPSLEATLEKLKFAALYCSLYLAANYVWPLEYALSNEFYETRSFFYRLMYVWPTFFIFRMRIYTGLTLSECVCTMAGFGAYPEKADSMNGEGPRIDDYNFLKRDAEKHKYEFTTIVNTRVWHVETCWTFREGMKHWNICVQYWLAVNIYKLFPSKKLRTAVTLLCSSYWHGFRPGHYFCLMGAPFYIPLEDMWNDLVRKDAKGLKRKVIDVICWIMKFFAFSYLGTAFLLVSFENIWKYYTSVYHFGYLAWLVLFSLGAFLSNRKEAAERRRKQKEAKEHGGEAALKNKPKVH